MSVRVVRDIICPSCEEGRIRVYKLNGLQIGEEPCPDCGGSGTVTERVTCATCGSWDPWLGQREGACLRDEDGPATTCWCKRGDQVMTRPDHGCIRWQPRAEG